MMNKDLPRFRYIPFKCPNCNGYLTVSYGKRICPVCRGTGIVIVDQDTGMIKVDDDKNGGTGLD
jgi:Zn finger protein HypA/HybF involved in hydrogenase expression